MSIIWQIVVNTNNKKVYTGNMHDAKAMIRLVGETGKKAWVSISVTKEGTNNTMNVLIVTSYPLWLESADTHKIYFKVCFDYPLRSLYAYKCSRYLRDVERRFYFYVCCWMFIFFSFCLILICTHIRRQLTHSIWQFYVKRIHLVNVHVEKNYVFVDITIRI